MKFTDRSKRKYLSNYWKIIWTFTAALALSPYLLSNSAESSTQSSARSALIGKCISENLSVAPELEGFATTDALGLKPTKDISKYEPETGIIVTKRNSKGYATEGKIRVLIDHPGKEIYVIGDFNNWQKSSQYRLTEIKGTPYYEGKIPNLKHGAQYRLLIDGQQILDPSGEVVTHPNFVEKMTGKRDEHLNNAFWDFENPGHYKLKYPTVDLRHVAKTGFKTDIFGLAKNWKEGNQVGPAKEGDTYRFISKSGIPKWLKDHGYNVIRLMPVNPSPDNGQWQFRFLPFQLRGLDCRLGTPEEFMMMMDAFHKYGIAVQFDGVWSHYTKEGNLGEREYGTVGMHNLKKPDGRLTFGGNKTEWGTYRYDNLNPFVNRYLEDAIILPVRRFGVDSYRIDNLNGSQSGLLWEPGARPFMQKLTLKLRDYRPDLWLDGEVFAPHPNLMKSVKDNGVGVHRRLNGELTVFWRENLFKPTEQIDWGLFSWALEGPWREGEPFRQHAMADHDTAANPIGNASGSYPHDMMKRVGTSDWVAGRKIQAAWALTVLSGSDSSSMLQVDLMQTGNFTHNPETMWSNLERPDVQRNLRFMTEVRKYFTDTSRSDHAFADENLHTKVLNHVDTDNGVVSLYRRDAKTGKKIYVLVNLGHKTIDDYHFGVDATSGKFKLVMDSYSKDLAPDWYQSRGMLTEAVERKGGIPVISKELHGQPGQVSIPRLEPWSVIIIEMDKAKK